MDIDEDIPIGQGGVLLTRDNWHAVMDALEGDESCVDDAFDALQRWAPPSWLEAHEARH